MDLIQYMSTYKFGTYSSNYDNLTKFYVQRTYAPNAPEVEANLATVDGLGQSANYATISKDSEYQLKDGEYLLINYTDSKTDESGTERKSVINKYYGKGEIIRPNFGIVDSLLYHNNHSYSKKDSFNFNEYVSNPDGMFTLGANEQIEIREVVNVELDTSGSYLY
jgi:G3E family GTPase